MITDSKDQIRKIEMKRQTSHIYASALATILTITAIGCQDQLPTGPEEDVILPLKVGNMWTGVETTYDANGVTISERFDTLKILDSARLLGEIWYRSNRIEGEHEIWYRNDDDGLYQLPVRISGDGMPVQCPSKMLRYPASSSEILHVIAERGCTADDPLVFSNQDSTVHYQKMRTVTSNNLPVESPAGTLSCYAYVMSINNVESTSTDETFPALRTEEFYAPSIGPVRIDWFQGTMDNPNAPILRKRWELLFPSI